MNSRFWRLGGLVGLPLLAYGIAVALARPAQPHALLKKLPDPPLAIAHRGGGEIWPENTLFAFERAARLGVHMIELDVHASADGVLVVMHDEEVDRTTNGTGPIHQKTLAEIKQLDAGYRWTNDGGQSYPFRGQGISVPTLEEVFQALPQMPLIIEIKQEEPAITHDLCRMIRQYGRQEDVMIGTFYIGAMEEMRQIGPEIATSAHANEVRSFVALSFLRLPAVYSPRFQAFQVPPRHNNIEIATPRFIQHAHERGVQVHVWTVDETDEMERLLKMGVDGILSDRPDLLMRQLGIAQNP
jgi:glycerophosphoryl diester phosphodiesterase